ncbi:unnamed protein product [Acanthoscelides obtectus]|uniref:Uncharacterized protein n=1 Tax=Acanthoscelides obtectus TaxID=200917 RepID=A0A9P0PAF8_ACAOB|nr:unnamed protein product [Acanthoscelides obtectus]CAK1642584.1 hypothetical protein AOBTE_LOCUS13126 [Acanthoscelides obtectus]
MTAVEVFNVEISKLYYFLLSDIIIKRFCRIYNTTLLITHTTSQHPWRRRDPNSRPGRPADQ